MRYHQHAMATIIACKPRHVTVSIYQMMIPALGLSTIFYLVADRFHEEAPLCFHVVTPFKEKRKQTTAVLVSRRLKMFLNTTNPSIKGSIRMLAAWQDTFCSLTTLLLTTTELDGNYTCAITMAHHTSCFHISVCTTVVRRSALPSWVSTLTSTSVARHSSLENLPQT